jgi:hypothetical protein
MHVSEKCSVKKEELMEIDKSGKEPEFPDKP